MLRRIGRLAPTPGGLTRWTAAVCAAWSFTAAGEAPAKSPAVEAATPTFTKDVAVILQKNCQECHRKGEVGPFPLVTYEQARKRAGDIATVTSERTMPPWKPEPGVGPKLKHDRSLSAKDLATLKAWAAAGAPQGDPKLMPPRPKFPDGWTLGTPDLIVSMLEDFPVPASGPDIYRCFVVPTSLPNDVYISAVEFEPGNHRVVHHMLTFLDTSGEARKLDAADPGPGYYSFSGPGVEIVGDLGGWTPGNQPNHLPDGIGRPFPSHVDVILQVHYHPNGRPEKDRSRIGLYFSKKPVKQTFHLANATSYKFSIPAGAPDYEVKASWYVPVDLEAMCVNPHMHMLGHDFRMTVTVPGGRTRDLIHIADWDPGWQDTYYFQSPVSLPKGSVVNVVGRFNNSAHPRNPNRPPKTVTFGQKSTDEMLVGYVGVVKKGQDLTQPGEKDDLFETLLTQHFKNQVRAEESKYRRQQERRDGTGSRPR